MPRRGNNRVGVVVVDSSVPTHKGEDEPHANDSIVDDGSREMKTCASAPTLDAAKAQRQKELLRQKKAERRAHAKQRTEEKHRRHEEKKQKRELQQMLEQDVPAVGPVKIITPKLETLASTQSLVGDSGDKVLDSNKPGISEEVYHDLTGEQSFQTTHNNGPLPESLRMPNGETVSEPTPRQQFDERYPSTEIIPKKLKTAPQPVKSANDAAYTIQKALKKKFKECKTMFRQSPRVFAEEIVVPSPAEDATTPANCDGNVSAAESPEATTLTNDIGPVESVEPAPPMAEYLIRPEPIVPPLALPQLKPSASPPKPSSTPSSRSCSSSCSCSDSGSCSSYSCSCSASSCSSSASEADKISRRRRRARHTTRTARSHLRKSTHRTARSSRRYTHSSSGPSYSLLPVLKPEQEKQYDELHHFMATKIQALVRGCRGRVRAQQRQCELDQELKDEAFHELQQEACLRIQSRTRGVLVRKKMPISDKERRRRRRNRSQHHDKQATPPVSPNGVADVVQGIYDDPDDVGEWPQEIDLEQSDDWQELSQPATPFGDTVTQRSFLSHGRLRVFCGTWNMHAKKPIDDLQLWIRPNKYHIVAVGSEECVNSIAKSVVFTSKKSWEDQLKGALGDAYVLVAAHALTAIHNVVFVHTSLLPLLGNIQSDAVATGLGNQLGNKGGVGIAFTVGTTSFAFVNSHFDAHQRNVSKRNGNFHRINHELKLSPTGSAQAPTTSVAVAPIPSSPNRDSLQGLGRTSANRFSMPTVTVGGATAGSKRTVSELFDRVFWYGDLNYRINGTRRMVDTLLLRNQFEVLYANDQLQREMKAGNVFDHFREGQPNFRPTYKFDKRSDVYDSSAKQRIPSWTDRVLYLSNYKANDIELLTYRSQTNFRTSDHRPVCAVFQVNFSTAGAVGSPRSPRSGQDGDQPPVSQACTVQ